MKILAFPKYGDIRNPVLYNLNKHFENDEDISIDEFNILKPFSKKYDIFHIHWPDYFFVNSFLYTLLRMVYFFTIIFVFKILNTKIIWTVHNLKPHNNYHPKINKFSISLFTKLLDSIVVMSKESKKNIYEEYPSLKSKKCSLIYHGLYDNYKNFISKVDAKKKLGIENNKKILLYIGIINEYKNILTLIDKFKKLNSDKYILIIAGTVTSKKLKLEIQKKRQYKNIIFDLKFIPDDELQYYFNASDLVVLPFSSVLNSGSVMLSLSFNRPVLCSNMGTLKELSDIVGHNIVNTYNEFSLDNIDAIIQNLKKVDLNSLKIFDNKILSQQLKQTYIKTINGQ